jgi:hypothetical protein
LTEQYQPTDKKNKPQVQGSSIVPTGYGADLQDWPRPSEIQRDDLGRAGVPGALGGVRFTIGQSRQAPAPTSEDAIRAPLPTKNTEDSQGMNPDAPLPPEKSRKPMPQQRTE